MVTFFNKLPIVLFDLDGTGTKIRAIRDILHRGRFLPKVLKNILVMYPYVVQDGETPEIIAAKLYGSPQYHWIVLLCNDIVNLWQEWPLSYDQFVAYLNTTYGNIPTAQTTVHHYQDQYGNIFDYTSYLATISQGSTVVYCYEYEIGVNDAKKQIQLV